MNNIIKLNPFQKVFYFEWKIDPSRTDYHMVLDQTLEGDLDIDRLSGTLKKIISDLLIFNSHIEESDGEYYWKQNKEIIELTYNDSADIEYNIYNFVKKPFDLEQGPLYRYGIFNIEEKKHRFIFIMQHIIVDGVSTEKIYSKISEYYNANDCLSNVNLSEQYKNIFELNHKLNNELIFNKNKYIDFWNENLNDFEPIDLSFLTEPNISRFKKNKENKNLQDYFNISEIKFSLSSDIQEKLKIIKKKFVITPYLFSKIIFAISIFKYTKQEKFCIAYPIAIKEAIDLIYGAGVNINILPFYLKDTMNVEEVILNAKNFLKSLKYEKIKYSYFPINELISKIKKNLISVNFSSANFQNILLEFNSIKSTINNNSNIALTNDFIFEIEATNKETNFRIDYKKNIISSNLIDNFVESYKNIYSEIIEELVSENPEKIQKKIKEYSILNTKDYKKIIYDWNSKENKKHEFNSLVQIFEKQVEKNPARIALVCECDSLTYNELNKKSNQLAYYLINNYEIKKDTLIALCLDRNKYMFIVILAVLKTGAAYVPIDPNFPKERIQFILQEINTKIILTENIHEEKLAEYSAIKSIDSYYKDTHNDASSLRIISLDAPDIQKIIKMQKDSNLLLEITKDHLAYVIFTSGTTGKPKGVLIEHAGVVNLAIERGKVIASISNYKYLNCICYANYVFDGHVWELCVSIFNGNCAHILSDKIRKDMNLLSDYIITHNIDLAFLPPVILNKENILNLKFLFVGGDKANKEIIDSYLKNDVSVFNAYGPTEASVEMSMYRYNSAEEVYIIGKPIANSKSYVLDPYLNPMPIGAVGELYIGGENIARSYLNRKELTLERFINNPFQTDIEKNNNLNSRIYKTGDLVRLLPEGNIEYMGRNDFQVKIRGFRIELGEIESVLLKHESIKQVVVVANEIARNNTSSMQNKVLVCYYTSKKEVTEESLANYLLSKLPEYMKPSFFIKLHEFPLNQNGKIDKKALPDPVIKKNNENIILPKNDIEKKVSSVWEEVLGYAKNTIDIHESFFSLGGDSITSIQVVSRLRYQYGILLSVKDIFKYKNIENISQFIINESLSNKNFLDIVCESGNLSGESPFLPIQKWFFENDFLIKNHWNQSFLIKTPLLNIEKLQIAVNKLIEQHDALRFTYYNNSNDWVQMYANEVFESKILYFNIKNLVEKEGSDLFSKELNKVFTGWQNNFVLSKPPLFSFGYVEGYKDGSSRIFIALHHLLVDVVSWRIITEDLQALYQEKSLEKKATSYRQWVSAIKNFSVFHEVEKIYWDNVVNDLQKNSYIQDNIFKSFIPLNSEKIQKKFSISKKLTLQVLTDCHKLYKTKINDILLSSFSLSLNKLTGNSFHYITLEGHGREEIEKNIDITKTVGWFTSMYPIRLDVKPSLDQHIISTKEVIRNVPRNGIGYGTFYKYYGILPKISFNFLGILNNIKENIFEKSENVWQIVNEESGESIHPLNIDNHFIAVNAAIFDEQLSFVIETQFTKELTEKLCHYFKQTLIEIIEFTSHSIRSYLTRSDICYLLSEEYLNSLQTEKEIENIYLASSLQQGFVYHSIKQGIKDQAYIEQIVWQYDNVLDIEKLKIAWEHAMYNYESLRLRFACDEEIIQIIDKESKIDWRYIDFTKEEKSYDISDSIKSIQEKDRSEPYNLFQGSLFRIYLIKISYEKYICIFSNHHAIIDGWSNPILLNFIHSAYLNLLDNKSIYFVQDLAYGDAQRYLSENKNENKKYWDNYVLTINTKVDLSGLISETAKAKGLKFNGYSYVICPLETSFSVRGDIYFSLKLISQKYSVTLNAILQFAWHKTLYIYSNSSQTTVGTTVSGRNLPIEGIENSVGLFINTLPLCVDHEMFNNKNIIECIKHIQEQISEINSRSNVNLTELQKNGNRLFDCIFVFENYPNMTTKEIDDRIKISLRMENIYEKIDYPLGVIAYEHGNALHFKLKFAGELFDNQSIKNILAVMEEILCQVSISPCCMESSLSYLNGEDNKKIINIFNSSCINKVKNKSIVEFFEEQVERSPNKVALVSEEIKLTYRELNERANRLAHYLKEVYQVTRETFVALFLGRSEQMLISILAVLKAGGAYVPIDPEYPEERIDFILHDANARVIIANEIYKKILDQKIINKNIGEQNYLSETQVIYVDEIETEIKLLLQRKYNLNIAIESYNLAYVIYTSGTTGKPKGVQVEHGGVVNLIVSQGELIAKEFNNRTINCLWFANYVFDAHVWELCGSIFHGHCLHLVNNEKRKDINLLSSYINTQRIHIAMLPPSLLDKENILNLELLIVAGDKTNRQILEAYLNNKIKVVNAYGPTEITVVCCMHKYENVEEVNWIGNLLPNTRGYVLDSNLKILPIGAVGELYVGGVGVSRGYLNRGELTLERYLKNPFQTEEEKAIGVNERIYKTGDLVRILPNGKLEYLGRNDSQVKIRGFRIELSEIENVLLGFQGIKQTVVIVREFTHKNSASSCHNKSLICYYVAESRIVEEELTCYLSEKLPEYMIPNAFAYLNELPLNVNGKLDKKALPEPVYQNQDTYVLPRTELEKNICLIWEEVLGLEKNSVGIQDNFFSLGGNSINAIKLVNKINNKLSLNFSLQNLLEFKCIENILKNKKDSQVQKVEIKKLIEDNLQKQTLSFAQERLWFIEKLNDGLNSYNIPMLYRLQNNINLSSLSKAFNEVVLRQEILRTVIKENERGLAYQVVLNNEEYLLCINKIECHSKDDFKNALKKEINYIYNLSNEIPVRIFLYSVLNENGLKENYLNIIVHHIAFDGWSVEILLKELYFLYLFYENKIDIVKLNKFVPLLNIQYKDFAYWQRSYINGNILDQQLKYWKNKLADYESIELYIDKKRPVQIDYHGHNVYFQIDECLSNELRLLAKSLDVSLFSLLLSSFYLMLSCFSGQKDLVIGTPVSNRHYGQISNLIGFFVNSLALRALIDDDESLASFIKSIGREIEEAQRHQDLPFEKLVEEIAPNRDPSKSPLFQVLFSIQGLHLKYEKPDLQLFYKTRDCNYLINDLYSPAKFDLSLFIDDTENNLLGCFNYATSLFYKETIINYSEVYKKILKEISYLNKINHNRSFFVKDLNFVPKLHLQKISSMSDSTIHLYAKNKSIVEFFEEQVERSPNKVALVSEEIKLTYRELNERANRLAHYLKEVYQVTRETFVALFLGRSEQMLISILAVLKAGGAYVPIDPEYPEERIDFILHDANARVIIANEIYKKILDQKIINKNIGEQNYLSETQVIYVDEIETEIKLLLQRKYNLNIAIESYNLAYVIYTSGTTGKPKGVQVEHGGVVNLIVSQGELIAKEFNNRTINCLWFANYVFDAHVWELCGSIFHGHCLHLVNNEKRKDINLLSSYINTQRIHIAMLPPSLLDKENILNLELLIVAGDKTNRQILEAYLNNKIKVVNAYGPTEITVVCCMHKYENVEEVNWIGNLLPNTRGYVLDSNLKILPIGAVGELYVGGVGVSRGYLNRGELTLERYLKNPFQTEEEKEIGVNERIYKTGDLVRILACGKLEYLGRNDSQVKIRGFRIELSEIENVLLGFQGIKQTVVIVREFTHKNSASSCHNKSLICYYVAESRIVEEELTCYLSEKLPEYMIPNAFVYLNELPLNVNGKLDKKALPEPVYQNQDTYVAPSSELEKNICLIWEEVLGLEKNSVGIHDNFFSLGGDSIISIQVVVCIRTKLGIAIGVKDIFKHKNIAKLVQYIGTVQEQEVIKKYTYKPILELNNSIQNPCLFLVHPARAGCEVYTDLAHSLKSDYHCYGIDNFNIYSKNKIKYLYVLSELYLDKIQQIMDNKEQSTYNLFGWSLGGYIALEMASILEKRGVKNIFIYLLDTFCYDEYLSSNKLSFDVFLEYMNYEFIKKDFDKVAENYEIENQFLEQKISSTLKHAKVLLFKAMKYKKDYKNKNLDMFLSYVTNLKENNISKVFFDKSQFKIVNVNTSTHLTIVQEERLIIDEMRKFKNNL